MQIRKLNITEHGATRPLYEEVFSEDSSSFVDYYYSIKTKDNTIFVVEEDEAVQAMIHLNPYTLMVNGKATPSNGQHQQTFLSLSGRISTRSLMKGNTIPAFHLSQNSCTPVVLPLSQCFPSPACQA